MNNDMSDIKKYLENGFTIGGRPFAVEIPEYESIRDYAINKYMGPNLSDNIQYHYTDIKGFMGILDNKELWASNTKFLNDRTECKQGLFLAIDVINELLQSNRKGDNLYYVTVKNNINKIIQDGSKENIYSLSFCKENDLLSQWRGYGKSGGIAIGFKFIGKKGTYLGKETILRYSLMDRNCYENVSDEKKKNDDFLPQDGEWIRLYDVIYDEEKQTNMLRDLIQLGEEAAINYSTKRSNFSMNEIRNIAQHVSDVIEYCLPIIKNKGFHEEKEIRYIWRDNGSRKIYFRERNNILLPYLRCMIRDLNCRELQELPIEDIVIGPQENLDTVFESIKCFLLFNGYEYLIPKLRISSIPYRE